MNYFETMIILWYNGVYFDDINSGTGSHHYLFIQFSFFFFFLITQSRFIFITEYSSNKIENNEQYSDKQTLTEQSNFFLFMYQNFLKLTDGNRKR